MLQVSCPIQHNRRNLIIQTHGVSVEEEIENVMPLVPPSTKSWISPWWWVGFSFTATLPLYTTFCFSLHEWATALHLVLTHAFSNPSELCIQSEGKEVYLCFIQFVVTSIPGISWILLCSFRQSICSLYSWPVVFSFVFLIFPIPSLWLLFPARVFLLFSRFWDEIWIFVIMYTK